MSKNIKNIKKEKEIKTEKELETEKELKIKNEDNEIEMDLHLYESLQEVFEFELKKIFKNIVSKYGSEYLFNEEDLITYYKKMKIEFSFKKSQSINSKQKDNEDLPNEIRCLARIWSNGYMDKNNFGGRCGRKKITNTDFCRQHNDHLVHGRYDKPPSKVVKGFFVKQNDPSQTLNDDEEK
jgi:hypothetical protein